MLVGIGVPVQHVLEFVGKGGARKVAVEVQGIAVDVEDFPADRRRLVRGIVIPHERAAQTAVHNIQYNDQDPWIAVRVGRGAEDLGIDGENAAFAIPGGGPVEGQGEGCDSGGIHAGSVPDIVLHEDIAVFALKTARGLWSDRTDRNPQPRRNYTHERSGGRRRQTSRRPFFFAAAPGCGRTDR